MSLSKIALAATIVGLASAQLTDKPVLDPPIDFGAIDTGLVANLASTQNTVTYWAAGQLPQLCVDRTTGAGLNPADVYAYEVLYSDCGDPWIMCRHKDSPIDEANGIDLWGKLAVAARSYVAHLLFLPGNRSAGSAGDSITFNGDANQITVFMHETGHSLDGHAYLSGGQLSVSQQWTDAYNADSAISDSYAATSQQENVAQEGNIALYDKIVPGGAANLGDGTQQIVHQYQAIQNSEGGNTILPGGTCGARIPNSDPVTVGAASAKFAARTLPDVSIKTVPVREYVQAASVETHMVMEHFDTKGRITHTSKVALH